MVGGGGRGDAGVRTIAARVAAVSQADAGGCSVVLLRERGDRADERPGAVVSVLFCFWRRRRGEAAIGRRACNDQPGGQENHSWHDGGDFCTVYAMTLPRIAQRWLMPPGIFLLLTLVMFGEVLFTSKALVLS